MTVTTRIWAAGCLGAVLVLAAGGWLVGVQPQLAHADEVNAAAESTDSQVATTQAKIAALSKAAASQADLEAKAIVVDKAVPSALQANTFVRRVNTVAALDAVDIQSIAVGTSTSYSPPAAAAAAAAPAASAAPSATPAPSATAASTSVAPVLAATDPRITSANLAVVPMTVVIKGTAAAGMQFIKDLQRDERLYLISGFTTSADPDAPDAVTTTLNGSVYALKD